MGKGKKNYILILIGLMAVSSVGVLTVKPVNAQLPTPTSFPPPIPTPSIPGLFFYDSGLRIYSPVNMTYNGKNLVLNVTLNPDGTMGELDPQISMSYSIDGSYFGSVPLKGNGEVQFQTTAIATINLPKLTDGSHELTIYLYGLNRDCEGNPAPKYLSFTYTVYFSTTGNPPTPSPTLNQTPTSSISFSSGLTVYSPLNQTYTSNELPLNVTFNWQASTQVFVNYSLDGNLIGQLPLSFGNITGFHLVYLAYGLVDLPKLSEGSHVLTFNVEAQVTNGAYPPSYWVNQAYFSINSSQPSPSSTPPIPELSWMVIAPLLFSMFSVVVIFRHWKTAKLSK